MDMGMVPTGATAPVVQLLACAQAMRQAACRSSLHQSNRLCIGSLQQLVEQGLDYSRTRASRS